MLKGSVEVRRDAFRIWSRSGRARNVLTFISVFKMWTAILIWFGFLSAALGVMGLESCVHGGTKYEEGEHFAPNDTLIKTEGPHQCVQCRCLQGLVLCEIENCSSTDCEAPVRNPRFCCPQCSGAVSRKAEASDFVFGKTGSDFTMKKDSDTDCFSNGAHFKNGSTWQPVIGPFGVMACVQCRCLEGNIICARVECADLRCPQPRRELGRCCPVCPAQALNKKNAFCLPKSSELFVFKATNGSDRIEYAFLENKWEIDEVKIHAWNLRAKSPADVFTLSSTSRKEFHGRNFKILGSVNKRRFRKYSRREKKLKNNCLTKCLSKVERLENSLLDFVVNSKIKCGEDEVDVSEI